eukprot:Clim_evm38s191 gene=Clim_evmTU38s191
MPGDRVEILNSRWEVHSARIGSGVYGTVLHGMDQRTGQPVAVKRLRCSEWSDQPGSQTQVCGIPQLVVREIALLKRLRHHNLVSLLDVVYSANGSVTSADSSVSLVFEYAEEDLSGFLKRTGNPGVPLNTIRKFAYQLFDALRYCHMCSIVHRDVKPANILVSQGNNIKLADFGMAAASNAGRVMTPGLVTLFYRAPEVLIGKNYDNCVDVWAAAAVIAELAIGDPFFKMPGQHSEQQQLIAIYLMLGPPNQSFFRAFNITFHNMQSRYTPQQQAVLAGNRIAVCDRLGGEGWDLLASIFRWNPDERLTAATALAHPFLRLDQHVSRRSSDSGNYDM